MNGRIKLTELMSKPAPSPSPENREAMSHIGLDEATDASDRCGRSAARGLFQGVILELENGNRDGVFYGAILGRIRLNPSVGISFVFEDAEGLWKVEINGSNLGDLHRELTLGRRESVNCTGGSVTAIEIKAWSPPGKKQV
ncbi:MAG: hypothetical protein K8U57_36995 [Planctomycetes bacterium]|nr:hypothetical protein [Planctomycetota bacterium]